MRFRSPYSGPNSLSGDGQFSAESLTATIFLGRELWEGAYFYFDPEISGGGGLSGSLGVAGALNGETYRVSDPAPNIYVARGYITQEISLSKKEDEVLDDDDNQVEERVSNKRLAFSLGRYAITDFFDNNKYSNDPRTQFMNWSLMSNGAWDYPANMRGYTYGLVAEYFNKGWEFHFSTMTVSNIANGSHMEYRIPQAHSEAFQIDRSFRMNKRKGTIRLLFSQTDSRAPSYKSGIEYIKTSNTEGLQEFNGEISPNHFGGKKYTIGLNGDMAISEAAGAFLRVGWNDGKYATWAFTEIDRTVSGGISVKGTGWKRPSDVMGLGLVVNGISKLHREFLALGGNGFILGDGRLNYGHEEILEFYYSAPLTSFLFISFDYQLVNRPGYNKDRGPVNAFALRGHVHF